MCSYGPPDFHCGLEPQLGVAAFEIADVGSRDAHLSRELNLSQTQHFSHPRKPYVREPLIDAH